MMGELGDNESACWRAAVCDKRCSALKDARNITDRARWIEIRAYYDACTSGELAPRGC
ncbi:hypothetical protein V1278_000007 [Bradyrhizobium sp. AZCC 1577]